MCEDPKGWDEKWLCPLLSGWEWYTDSITDGEDEEEDEDEEGPGIWGDGGDIICEEDDDA